MQKQKRISYVNNLKKIQKWWKKIYQQKSYYFINYIVLPKIIILSQLFKKLYFKKLIRNLSKYKINKIVNCNPYIFRIKNKKQLSKLALNEKNNRSNSLANNQKINILSHKITEHSNSATIIHKRTNTEKINIKKINQYLEKPNNIFKNLSHKKVLTKKVVKAETTANIKLKQKKRSNKNINKNNNQNIMRIISNETFDPSKEHNFDYSKDLNLSSINNNYINSSTIYPTIHTNEQNINNNCNKNTTIQCKSSYNFFSKISPTCLVKFKRKTNNKTKLFIKFHKWKKYVEKRHIIALLRFQFLFNYKCKSFNKRKKTISTYKNKDEIAIIKLKKLFISLVNKKSKNAFHLMIENMLIYKKYIYFNRYRDNISKIIILQKLKENKKFPKRANKIENKEKINNININNFINYSNFSKNTISFNSLLTERFDDFFQVYKKINKLNKYESHHKKKKEKARIYNNETNLTMQINQLKMIFNIMENQRIKRFKNKKLLMKYYLNKWKIQKDKIKQKNNFRLIYHKKKLSFYNNLVDNNNIIKNKNNKHRRINTSTNLDINNTFLERYKTDNNSLKNIRNDGDCKYGFIKYKQNSIEEKEVVFPTSIVID